jgi:FkbM family methyltransferase
MSGWRQTALHTARRLGVEPQLRHLQDTLESKGVRRDRRDGRHLRVLLAGVLAPDASCVDVGANLGVVLDDFVRCAPEGRHVAYEPLPELAADLARRYPEVDVRNAAVSDHRGTATFFRDPAAHSQSSLSVLDRAPGELEELEVELVDLDSSLPPDMAPALLKIDVEGAEEQVLRGARETLRRHRPVVVLEHGAGARFFGTRSETIHELLSEAGLRVYDVDGQGPYTAAAFAARVSRGDLWTFLARP